MHSIVASAATSGIFTPPNIVATWGGFSSNIATFNLSNLNNLTTTYSVAMSSGTGTPTLNTSTGVLTVTSTVNFEATITHTSIKGNLVGTSKILGKQTITTYNVTSQGGCVNGAYTPNCACGCVDCSGGSCEGDGCCFQFSTVTTTYENSPPANYQKIGSVWVRL